jgi:hypothetical protein
MRCAHANMLGRVAQIGEIAFALLDILKDF